MLQMDEISKSAEAMVVKAYQNAAPGAAIVIVKKGQVLYRKAIGLANLEHQVPLTPDMPFLLGSLTKPFTSTAILMLVEAGTLALTDSLDRLLPDYPMGEVTITLEHLLTHTSGIPDYTELPEWWAIHRQDVSVDQLIDVFKTRPKLFAPGTRWVYCNSGYVLLGAIIEKVSGKSYGEFLAENIFAPLEMSSTFYDATTSRVIPKMVKGYSKTPNTYTQAEYFSYSQLYAAGGMVSTLDDLARWFAALRAGKLLTAETFRKMRTPYLLADGTSTRYGYGWWLSEYQGRPVAEHYGQLPGCVNYLLALPDDDILVIVLSNDDGKLNQVEQMAVEMAALTLGKPYQPPSPIVLSTAELRNFDGNYMNNDGISLTVVDEFGQLILRTPLGQFFALQPQSQVEFFLPENPESRLVFSQVKDIVTGFEWLPRRGMPIRAQKTS